MKQLLPEALQPYAPQVLTVFGVSIFVLGWLVAKLAARLTLTGLRRRKVDEALGRFLSRLVMVGLMVATVITSLGTVGLRTTSFIALLGSAGLAVGLALQGSLAHFAAGVLLLFFRPFSHGDWVTMAGQTGRVEDIGLFATSLVTAGGEKVAIPNAKVTGDAMVNLTVLGLRRACVELGVPYGAEIATVKDLLVKAALGVADVTDEPAPDASLTNATGGAFTFTTCVWCRPELHGGVTTALRETLYEALVAGGLEVK